MKVLVTGASGFLGQRVVLSLRERGHDVRALVRPGSPSARAQPIPGVEVFRADLCLSPDLEAACEGVDAVVHLAARMQGDAQGMLEAAVGGTRRLLDAVERSRVRRFVLASSLSVYDWGSADGSLDEDSPLERRPEDRDAYTTAKLRQEELVRERCASSSIALTVLRPAYIWGTGRDYPPTLGLRMGPVHVLIAPSRQLPSIHVENCADAFAETLRRGPALGLGWTFNLVDHPEITVRRFARDFLRRSGSTGLLLPAPYRLGLASVGVVHRLAPSPLAGRLPSFAAPARFAARYKPLRVSGARFREAYGWSPPSSYERCLDRTFGATGIG